MWVIVGTRARSERVPGGAKLEHHCQSCGETTMFYEKEMTDTFRLYFIDVFDVSKQRVMACGACGAHYATDEVGARTGQPAARHDTTAGRIERGVQATGERVGSWFERAADRLESGVDELVYGKDRQSPARQDTPPAAHEDPLDDPLDDPMEAKFRELERKAGIRK